MAGEYLTVVAHIRAKPGKEAELEKALLALVEPTTKEDGCLNYDLHRETDDAGHFVFYENWTSREALDRHLAAPHLEAFRARAENLLAAPPDIRTFRMLHAPTGRAAAAR
jgi:quinol monooxygenase YgiN